jgi:hypothetical protein
MTQEQLTELEYLTDLANRIQATLALVNKRLDELRLGWAIFQDAEILENDE